METVLVPVFTAIQGPAGALILCLIIFFGIYKLIDKHVAPSLTAYNDSIKEGFTSITGEMRSDREYHRQVIDGLANRHTNLEVKVDKIATDVHELQTDVNGLASRLDK
jgi:hypothetical protein